MADAESPNPATKLIDVDGLAKQYGNIAAVDGISFTVHAGEVVGFLGPNGAGKSTTMRMLTTYLPPTSGTAEVGGFDVLDDAGEVRRRIGYLPEHPPLYGEMRIEAYLKFVSDLKGVPKAARAARVEWAMDVCGLTERRRQLIRTLSKGFRQRVGLAQAILHDPRVLILDEPTSGLDPNQILEIRQLIADLAADRTILLSTHILQEVVNVCNRVLIIHQGKLVHDAPLGETRHRGYRVRFDSRPALDRLRGLDAVASVQALDPTAVAIEPDGSVAGHALLSALVDEGLHVEEFAPLGADLERIFVELTSAQDPQAEGRAA